MKTARFERRIIHMRNELLNTLNRIRISYWAKKYNVHVGTRRILKGGVWIDRENYLYNCMGQRIGKIQWEESY